MICKSCNTEAKEGALFCACCGSKLVYGNTNSTEEKKVKPVIEFKPVADDKQRINEGNNAGLIEKPYDYSVEELKEAPNKKRKRSRQEKKNTGWIVCGMISTAIVGAAATACVMYMTNPYVTWTRVLEQESFASAIDYFRDNKDIMTDEQIEEVEKKTVSAAEDIVNQYKNREIDYAVAVNQLEKMNQLENLEEDVEELLDNIEKINISRSDFNTAEKLFSENKYIEAKEYYDKVVAEDVENYNASQERIADCIKGYKEATMAKIESYEKEQKYEDALAVAQNGLQVLKNDEQFLTKSNELDSIIAANYKEKLISLVKEKQEAKKYEAALKEFNNYSGNDEDIMELKKQVTEDYEKEVIDFVEAAVTNGKIEAAKKKLNDAKAVISTSEKINKWAAEIDSYMPVSLTTFETFTTESNNSLDREEWQNGKDYDNVGNTYEDGFAYKCFSRTKTECMSDTYLVEGKYNTFSATWVTKKNSKDQTDSSFSAKVYVYGDGVCLYSSPVTKGAVYPHDFEVDITNVNELTIKVEMRGNHLETGLVNPRLAKTLTE